MRRFLYFLSIPLMILSCAMPSFLTPEADQPIADCSALKISDADAEMVLDYGNPLFSGAGWERSYTVNDDHAYVSYINNDQNAVAFVDAFTLCNARSALQGYANPQNLDIMLQNYDTYQQVASCQKGDNLMFEFEARNDSYDYNIRLWLTPLDNPHLALEVMLVYDQKNATNLDLASLILFPNFSSCE